VDNHHAHSARCSYHRSHWPVHDWCTVLSIIKRRQDRARHGFANPRGYPGMGGTGMGWLKVTHQKPTPVAWGLAGFLKHLVTSSYAGMNITNATHASSWHPSQLESIMAQGRSGKVMYQFTSSLKIVLRFENCECTITFIPAPNCSC